MGNYTAQKMLRWLGWEECETQADVLLPQQI